MEIVIAIASKVAEYGVAPIARQIGYVINYKSNVENYKEQVKQLTGARERVQHSVDEAKRNAEEIKQDVDMWLNRVTKITEEAEEFIVKDEDKAKKRCLNGWCPNLKSRYQLSKKAKKKMEAVVKLQVEGNFPSVSYLVPLPEIWSTSIEGLTTLESRMEVLEEIMEALRSSNLSVIGVYGMGGVGKTTLVEQVARKAKEDKLFDKVVMATVKEPPNVREIQETIAEKLSLKFDEETESRRADRLWNWLKIEKKILVILDNVCTALVLKEIGIPFGDDHQGCKILLISRYQDVLSREMGTQKDFLVEFLPEDEAWSLFEKMVGDVVKDAKVRPIAIEVAKRCEGLPVLIVTVARALRNESLYNWKDALKKLARFDNEEQMNEKVYSALELSYNHLKGEEVKSLFLLCSQKLHDEISIQYLLIYSWGLGIFNNVNNLEEVRNRVHKLINDLKASCLLLEGENPGSVKMHDIVHNFALSIASRDHRELKEWPPKDMLEQCTSVSWSHPKIHELPEELQCPQAKSFLMCCGDRSLKIPENFFKGMEKLKVLDLTNVHLLSLPLSLQFLKNLRTLCLDSCVFGDIATLGELKKLEILTLVGSNIVQLPREIGKLTHLLLLDLSRCSRLEVISPGVLSSLSQLQELYMGNSFAQWESEESNSQRSNASLDELMNLSNLISLDIHIPDAKILPKEFFSRRLERYRILIGDELDWSDDMHRTSRMLKIKLHICFHMEYEVKMLLKETEDLHLYELNSVENVLFELDGEGFPHLKHLHVQNSPEILNIINSKGRVSFSAFPILESLILEKLINLEKICHGQLTVGSFAKLRTIKVESCHKLRYLFAISLAAGLRQLQEIEVTKCEIMEEIVADRSEDDANYNAAPDKIELTRLRSLTLQHLPQLTRFCSIAEMPSISQRGQKPLTSDIGSKEIVSEDELTTLTPPFNEKVVFPNLEELKLFSISVEKIWHDQLLAISFHIQNLTLLILDGCDNLKYLFSTSMVKSLAKLKNLEICHCKFMERVIVTEEEGMIKMVFPKLELLKLNDLPKLTSFCSQNFIEFPTLRELWVENCPDLEKFISNSMCADIIPSEENEEMKPDENLRADILAFFDDKVELPSLEKLHLANMNLKKIWHDKLAVNSFCKLDSLKVDLCENLLSIFPSNMLERLGRLDHLHIVCCHSLAELFEHQVPHVRNTHAVGAPQLRLLCLIHLPKLKHVWNEDIQETLAFQKLRSIRVINCQSLEHLFPAFVARGLLQLEVFEITDCRMKEIVAKEKGVEVTTTFVFPRVTSMKLWKLPELQCFYPGIHTSEWPMLKELVVDGCDKVERFALKISSFQETHGESHQDIPVQKSLFLVGKVAFPNLEELRLERNNIMKEIWHGQFSAEYFPKLKVLELICFPEKSVIFSTCFLQSVPNLEKLLVSDALFKEIFLCEGFTSDEKHVSSHTRLSELKLSKLPELMYLWKETFQPGPVFQNLETLEVLECGKLTNLVPSSISFQNLTTLMVSKCHGLIHLVTPSIAKTLVQLTEMSLIECDMIEEIVANKGEEKKDEIVFSRLKYMKLYLLPRLTSFCSDNYTFNFPSLEEVIVRQCPKIKIFSVGASSAPKLQKIQVAEDECHWEGNLNTTIQWLSTEMVGFHFLECLNLSEVPEIQEIWHGQNPGRFRHLRSLVVDKCAFLLNAISSNLLRFLNNLEVLAVINCDLLEEVFDLEGLNAGEGHLALLPQLSKFSLSDLPRLRHIWKEDVQRILGLKNLKLLKVHNCSSLRNVCAPSLALGLLQLEEMEIKNCPMIEKIITTGVVEAEIDKIVFPRLGSIILESLPNLTSFYSGTSILECPSLKNITIIDCPNMKTFTTTVFRKQEPKIAGEGDEQRTGKGELDITIAPFFNEKVVLPSLKELLLKEMKNLKKIWHDKLAANSFCKLYSLVVKLCENLLIVFPSNMLERLQRLDHLHVECCGSLEELFEHPGPDVRNTHAVAAPQLRLLCLIQLPKLKHVWNEDIQETIAFQNLRSIKVVNCQSLEHLFPAFVARGLLQLEVFEITDCRMKEIVAKEKGVEAATTFVFPRVTSMKLWKLPELKCFYPGIHTSEWPMLKKLVVYGCGKVERFASKISSFQETHGESQHDIPVQQSLFLVGKVAFPNLKELRLEMNDNMKEIWHGQFSVEYFCKLKVLELIRFPKELGIFPSCFLQDLLNLEKLVVSNAFFKEIFPCERIYELEGGTTLTRLSELKLSELPELMHLWKEGFQGGPAFENLGILQVSECDKLKILVPSSISFQNLTILEVSKCQGLINLVTLSTARSLVQLSKMIITECELMTEVIANEGSEAKDEITFNQIKYLRLHCLPSLTSFYSGSYTFDFPSLEEVIVEQCPKLKIFFQGVLSTPKLQRVQLTEEGQKEH